MAAILLLVLALIAPPAPSAPVPSPSLPAAFKTIVTVKSSPYCASLGDHFNAALSPMVANDRVLDGVSVQLDDLNTLFYSTDYAPKFLSTRRRLQAYDRELLDGLPAIQEQINRLRQGEKLAADREGSAAVHATAQELQRAYDKQRAMAIDLQGIVQSMMEFDITAPHPIGGGNAADATLPKDMKDIKSYLRFDGQRDVIADAETKAVDIAYDTVTTRCAK